MVSYNQRGYVGYSRSVRAALAEDGGKFPMIRAAKLVAEQLGCTQAAARIALELLHDGEWHHVGKYAQRCDYYDCTDTRLPGTIQHILYVGGAQRWKKRREKLRQLRSYPNGRYPIRREPGRIVKYQQLRRMWRNTACEAVGHEITERYPLQQWERLAKSCPRGTEVQTARQLGWSDDLIALTLADGGWSAEHIRESLAK